jgi:hypothetical protein
MHPDLLEVAKELNLVTEYKTIRVASGEVVKVEDSISSAHQRILEAAYKAGAAKREWVGLTNDEITEIDQGLDARSYSMFAYTRAIEAKLKEKNS